MAAWIALATIAGAVVLGPVAALLVSRRRERRAEYRGEHRVSRRGPGGAR